MPHYMTRFFLTCFCIAWVPWFGQTAEPPTTTSEREDEIFWDSVFSHNHVLDIQITLPTRHGMRCNHGVRRVKQAK